MTRLLAQLCMTLGLLAGLSACVDREGPADPERPVRYFVDPVPDGVTQYQSIVEPFLAEGVAQNSEGDAEFNRQTHTLFSFDPAQNSVAAVLDSAGRNDQAGIVQPLNTTYDLRAESEYSILVRNDSVFVVDHADGSYRGLVHFSNPVCAVKPKTVVKPEPSGASVSYQVLHDHAVYVQTTEGDGSRNDCADPTRYKRYYRLALNFRFDAFANDPSYSNDLVSVTEAEYTAELVFGWRDTGAAPDMTLDYGFLGYDSQASELVFFDQNRQRRWTQARQLERFTPVSVNGGFTAATVFQVDALPDYQYLVQLGRDVFVVDAGREFFDRAPSEVPAILSDRVLQRTTDADNVIRSELRFTHNNADVLIYDASKLFRYPYAPATTPPNAANYSVQDLSSIGYGRETFERRHLFSQFDLRSCDFFSDVAACELVNFHQDSNVAAWQFITACTAGLGCSMPVDTTDYCTTQAEFIQTQNGSNLCSVRNYLHLNELNDTSNDASLVGFMPYVADYARDLEFMMDEQSVFITARMNERDILIRYFYQLPLSDPKSSREKVVFGQRIAHAGLDAYLSEGNLFVTVLNNLDNNVRSNECYENYQQIDCEECSVDERLSGLCVDHYREYRSMALFCSAQQLTGGTCTDNQIIPVNQLLAHAADRDGKWLEVKDLANQVNGAMGRYLSLVQSDSVSDEGVLSSPSIVAINNQSGAVMDQLESQAQNQANVRGSLVGQVESVESQWILDAQLRRLNLIGQDVFEQDATFAKGRILFIGESVEESPEAVEAGATHFVRKSDSMLLQ